MQQRPPSPEQARCAAPLAASSSACLGAAAASRAHSGTGSSSSSRSRYYLVVDCGGTKAAAVIASSHPRPGTYISKGQGGPANYTDVKTGTFLRNVRSAIEDACLNGGLIQPEDIPPHLRSRQPSKASLRSRSPSPSLSTTDLQQLVTSTADHALEQDAFEYNKHSRPPIDINILGTPEADVDEIPLPAFTAAWFAVAGVDSAGDVVKLKPKLAKMLKMDDDETDDDEALGQNQEAHQEQSGHDSQQMGGMPSRRRTRLIVANDTSLLAAPLHESAAQLQVDPTASSPATEVSEVNAVEQTAVVVIAGTGSIVTSFRKDEHGAVVPIGRSGGFGWILGDEGSAFAVGREAIKRVLEQANQESLRGSSETFSSDRHTTQAHRKVRRGHLLRDQILEQFKVGSTDELLAAVYSSDTKSAGYNARGARVVPPTPSSLAGQSSRPTSMYSSEVHYDEESGLPSQASTFNAARQLQRAASMGHSEGPSESTINEGGDLLSSPAPFLPPRDATEAPTDLNLGASADQDASQKLISGLNQPTPKPLDVVDGQFQPTTESLGRASQHQQPLSSETTFLQVPAVGSFTRTSTQGRPHSGEATSAVPAAGNLATTPSYGLAIDPILANSTASSSGSELQLTSSTEHTSGSGDSRALEVVPAPTDEVRFVHKMGDRKHKLASLSRIVFDLAFHHQDRECLSILRSQSRLLARQILQVVASKRRVRRDSDDDSDGDDDDKFEGEASQVSLTERPGDPLAKACRQGTAANRGKVDASNSILCTGGSLLGVERYRQLLQDECRKLADVEFKRCVYVDHPAHSGAVALAKMWERHDQASNSTSQEACHSTTEA